jgi:hypothetical protein
MLVAGYSGVPANVTALLISSTGMPTLASPSVPYLRSNYTPTDWSNLLAAPLSISQLYSVRAMLGGNLADIPTLSAAQRTSAQTVLNANNTFNASVTPEIKAQLLALALAKTASF